MLQVSVLEPLSGKPLAQGRVKSLAAQQRTGGKVRAWVLDIDGVPCALDDSPISRGLKGAIVQLETHDIASIARSTNPALQVSTPSLSTAAHDMPEQQTEAGMHCPRRLVRLYL